MKKIKQFISSLFIIFYILNYKTVVAIDLPREMPVPGGIKILNISQYCHSNIVKAYFNNKEVLILHEDHKLYAVIGIPLNVKAIQQVLTVIDGNKITKIKFIISKSNYPIETLNYNLKKSITHESFSNINSLVYNTWTITHCPNSLLFNKPVSGLIIGKFGLKRIYLNSLRPLHNGIDISAPYNTLISTPLSGTIILMGKFNLFGNTIIIDHGHGLLTLYAHLNNMLVRKNQQVIQGQFIGTSGQGDIIYENHLHWSVILNGVFVNPELFIK